MAKILEYKRISNGGNKNRNGSTSIREVHIIQTDAPVSRDWIARHRATPKLNVENPEDPGYWWDDLDFDQKAPLVWECKCSASPFQFDPIPDSPLIKPAAISIDSELVEQPTLFDRKNRPIMTRAGEWIHGVTVERPLLTYNITKNLPNDPAWLETHLGAVNSDPVRLRGRICQPNTLMLRRMSFSEYTTENRVWYTTCSISLHYDPQTWIRRLWNRGTIQLIQRPRTVKGKQKQVWVQERIKVTENGVTRYIEDPVPLTWEGTVVEGALTPGEDSPVDVSKLRWIDFEVQPVQRFTGVLPLT